MIVVRLAGALRGFAGDTAEIRLDGSARTVAEALALLWVKAPALRDRVVSETGDVRRHINVFAGSESIRDRDGIATLLRDGEELFLAPAVSGGSL